MPSGKFHCCLVMLLIDKLDADAMHPMPMIESSIVIAKMPFVLWTHTNAMFLPGVESPMVNVCC